MYVSYTTDRPGSSVGHPEGALGMVHAWVSQKHVKSNILPSFIQCHIIAIESLFNIDRNCDMLPLSLEDLLN
jgi:hypothetical protein